MVFTKLKSIIVSKEPTTSHSCAMCEWKWYLNKITKKGGNLV